MPIAEPGNVNRIAAAVMACGFQLYDVRTHRQLAIVNGRFSKILIGGGDEAPVLFVISKQAGMCTLRKCVEGEGAVAFEVVLVFDSLAMSKWKNLRVKLKQRFYPLGLFRISVALSRTMLIGVEI